MSWDADLIDADGSVLFEQNYTHNTNPMIREAGWSDWWEGLDGMDAPTSVTQLCVVIDAMEAAPAKFRAMDPPNRWGSYHTLLPVLREMRDVAARHNGARWQVSG